jgi:hypothetical protein
MVEIIFFDQSKNDPQKIISMFLYVNPHGTRHTLLRTFNDVVALAKHAFKKNFTVLQFTILEPGNPGIYDLVIKCKKEELSGTMYAKVYIIPNPKNMVGESVHDVFSLLGGIALPRRDASKSFNVISFFPETCSSNGFLILDKKLPPSGLDNFDEMMENLTDFFAPKPNPSTPTPPTTDTSRNRDIDTMTDT